MENSAVSDTGPILHLAEIDFSNAFDTFSKVIIPDEVSSELKRNKVGIPKNIKIAQLKKEFKDKVKVLTNQYNLDSGEAEAISLIMQEKSDYLLTDDLEARQVAKEFNIDVHGTAGIILRAFRDKIIDKKTALIKIVELKNKSSLFITQDLINEIIKAINAFSKK